MTNDLRDRFVTGGAMQGRLGQLLLGDDGAPPAVAPGRRIGAFEIGQQIGSGGMGAVFRASRVVGGFEQTVAIKLMLASDTGRRERFRAEMEILAALGHPHIAQLVDGGETDDGLLYLAMEYIDGVPLDEYCERRALGTRERIRLLLAVADALAHAHRNLVIHRDIKPSNILVNLEDGRPKLLDFGIAKLLGAEQRADLTQQGFGPMTPTYAAPEQFRSQPVSVATDVYQFGVLSYRLLSGGLPYEATTEDPIAWARAVLDEEPLALSKARLRRRDAADDGDVPVSARRSLRRGLQDLDAIVRMALMKDPSRRYGSMDAVIADLDAFLDGRPVVARHGGTGYRIVRFSLRHRWAVLGSSLAVLGLAATTLVAVSQALHARKEAVRLRASVDLLHGVFRAADVSSGSGGRRSLEDLLDVAAKEVVQGFDAHPDLRAGVLLQVADAYAGMGLPARAAPLYRQAIDDVRAQPDPDPDPVLVQALARGALASYWDGQYVQARAWIDEAARLATGDDDESARIRDGLYFTRWQMLRTEGRSQECHDVAQQAVRNAERASAQVRDALMQGSLVSRGTSATDLTRFEEGERDLLAAVALARRLYGDRHAATLKAQQALGWHYGTRGDAAKSLAILEPIGQQVLTVFGARSLEWGRNLHNRGNAYAALDGRWEDAVRAYLDAAQIYRDSSSPGRAAGGLFEAAGLLREHGRCREALPIYAEMEALWSQTSEMRNPAFRRVYIDMADCELEIGDIAAARRSFERGSSAYAPAEQHDAEYAELLAVGARVLDADGRPAEAGELLRRAIDLVRDDVDRAELVRLWQQRLQRARASSPPDTNPDPSAHH
jgi:tetratricopeptide (TPR) repeat protein/predicted Ser/Thr protein kinase